MTKDFTFEAYLDTIRREAASSREFDITRITSRAEFHTFQTQGRQRLHKLLNIDAIPHTTADLAPEEIECAVDMGTYVRKRVSIALCKELRVPVYLLEPKQSSVTTGHKALALCLHGHGYGSRMIIGLQPDGEELADKTGCFALELCTRGFTVAVPEIIGFGDTKLTSEQTPPAQSSCEHIVKNLSLLGLSVYAFRVYEIMRTLDYMLEFEGCTSDDIVCIGHSGGGTLATLVSALEDRISATAVIGYISSFYDSIMTIRHCLCNYIDSVYRHFDMCDIIALHAPKPLFIESGESDTIFPAHAVRESYQKLQRLYTLLGASENNLQLDIFEGGHMVCGRRSFDFLRDCAQR